MTHVSASPVCEGVLKFPRKSTCKIDTFLQEPATSVFVSIDEHSYLGNTDVTNVFLEPLSPAVAEPNIKIR